jgi:hypothetical protein
MENHNWSIKAGPPIDYPGCWIVSGTNMSGDSWAIFRKEDGTYWEIAREVYFPRSGGTLHVDLGNKVTDESRLGQLREYYLEWQQTRYRVEVFDCPERGFRNFADRQSAHVYRDSLVGGGVKEANIRVVAVNGDGMAH